MQAAGLSKGSLLHTLPAFQRMITEMKENINKQKNAHYPHLDIFSLKKWHGKLKRYVGVGHYVIPSMLQTTLPPLIRSKWSLTNKYYAPDLHLSNN